MKPRIYFRFAIVLIAVVSLVYACKKDNTNSTTSNQNTIQTQGDDQTMVSNESDNIANDADASLTSQSSINGNAASQRLSGTTTVMGAENKTRVDGAGTIVNDSLICDASVVIDTTVSPRTVTITYNGTNCWGNRTRTGTVVVSIPEGVHWKDVGATVSITIQNLKITRVSDNKSITLNGTRTMTNVSGGSLIDLANLGSVTHSISDSLSITFADNATRLWQVSKQRVFTYNNGIVITTTGTHTDGNTIGIAEWGTNRFGTRFESLITEPKVIRQDCDFRLVSGQNRILRSDSLNSTITYGLDANGNATSCPGLGVYYFQIIWSFPNGKTIPIILPY